MGSVVTDEPSTLGKRGRICWGAGLNTIAVAKQRRAGTFDLKLGEKFSPPYILPCTAGGVRNRHLQHRQLPSRRHADADSERQVGPIHPVRLGPG